MQDDIHTKNFPYKVNAITLLGMNDELKNLCLDANGKYIYVNSKGELEEYE